MEESSFSEEMIRVLRKHEAEGSQEKIPVIITLKPDLSKLERSKLESKLETEGLNISSKLEILNVLSGFITPKDARKIAKLVEKIEYDSEMKAF